MRIISHVLSILFRQRHDDRRPAFVELELEPHPRALHRIAMKVRNDDRTGIELYCSHPPRRALPKIRLGRCPHGRLGHQCAAAIDIAEWKSHRQA